MGKVYGNFSTRQGDYLTRLLRSRSFMRVLGITSKNIYGSSYGVLVILDLEKISRTFRKQVKSNQMAMEVLNPFLKPMGFSLASYFSGASSRSNIKLSCIQQKARDYKVIIPDGLIRIKNGRKGNILSVKKA